MKPIRRCEVKAAARRGTWPRAAWPRGAAASCAALAEGLGARLVHQRAHALDSAVEAAEDRLAHEEVTDIELDDRGNGGDRSHRLVAEAVAGVAFETDRLRMGRRLQESRQLALPRGTFCLAIGARMKLDHRRAELAGGVELGRLGIDEEGDPDL